MQEIVANVTNVKFDIEWALDHQLGAQPLPFPGMDKSGSAVCTFFLQAACDKDNACPFRHIKGDRTVVCKHWLRGLCKKGDDCEFLHEYDMSKMPECYFFSKFGQCGNKECPFLHIDPEKKIRDCPWYDRGFCRHGPNCKNRHVRRVMCQNYLCGFCLDGPDCKYVHPKFDIPPPDPIVAANKAKIVCHLCSQPGHKSYNCPNTSASPSGNTYNPRHHGDITNRTVNVQNDPNKRPLEDVTCYKCNERGHYANKCPKGHLAFLSTAHKPTDDHMEQ